MKNTLKLKAICKIAGIIALLTVIGFSIAACDDGTTKSPLQGTWKNEYTNSTGDTIVATFKLAGSAYSYTYERPIGTVLTSESGQFSYTDTTITFNRTKPSTATWTQNYTLTEETLWLQTDGNNYHWYGRLTKQ